MSLKHNSLINKSSFSPYFSVVFFLAAAAYFKVTNAQIWILKIQQIISSLSRKEVFPKAVN